MKNLDRRRLGRLIRKYRRLGWPKELALYQYARYETAWEGIREAARPAIQHLLACIAAEEHRPQIIHNGRKPR